MSLNWDLTLDVIFFRCPVSSWLGEVEEAAATPQSRHVKIENKNFYFACKKNAKGRYITISEVKGNFKNTILVPESGWEDFRDVFEDYTKQCKIQEWKGA